MVDCKSCLQETEEVSQELDPLEDRMTKTRNGTSSPTAGSAHQEHRILPQSLPDIMQSLQERNVILWLKIYVVADEQDCKAE